MVSAHCKRTCELCTSNSFDSPIGLNIYQERKEDKSYNIPENPTKDSTSGSNELQSSEYGILIDEKEEIHKVPAFETSDPKGNIMFKEQFEMLLHLQIVKHTLPRKNMNLPYFIRMY